MNPEEIKFIENYWKNYNMLKREKELLESAFTARQLKTDVRYPKIVEILEAIDTVYSELNELFQQFVDVRYWGELSSTFDYAEVADLLNVSVAKTYKIRTFIMKKTAETLGIITEPVKL